MSVEGCRGSDSEESSPHMEARCRRPVENPLGGPMELEFTGKENKSAVRRVLARKYRPKFLCDLIGQDLLVQALERGIIEGRLPQAILLHGIRGTGKTSTARILARALNCTGPDGQGGPTVHPCGQCPSCKAFDEDRHPDVLEMDAASHTGVDDIREVIDSAQYRAILGRCKVFIIDEVHMLSKSAFNALLKTLEEPPAHVLFVFATTEINKIPETILSRCSRFDLKRVDSRILMNHVRSVAEKEGYALEQDALALLARAADGSVRDSLTLLDQAMNLTDAEHKTLITSSVVQGMVGVSDRQKVYSILMKILERKPEEVVTEVRSLTEKGEDPVAFFQDLMESLYRVACLKMMPRLSTDETVPEFERKSAHMISVRVEVIQLLSLWKKMLKGYEDVKKAPFAQQALEMTLLRLCYAASLPSLESVLTAPPALDPDSPSRSGSGFGEKGEAETGVKGETQLVSEPLSSESPQDDLKDLHHEPSSRQLQTFEDLMKILEEEREVLLLSYLKRDVAFVSFDPGKIIVQLKNDDAAKVLPMLKTFLHKATGETWIVQVDTTGKPCPSWDELQKESQKKLQEETLETPLFKSLQENFPGTTVEFEFDPS